MFIVLNLLPMAVIVSQIMAVHVLMTGFGSMPMAVVVIMSLLFHAFHDLLLHGIHIIHACHNNHMG